MVTEIQSTDLNVKNVIQLLYSEAPNNPRGFCEANCGVTLGGSCKISIYGPTLWPKEWYIQVHHDGLDEFAGGDLLSNGQLLISLLSPSEIVNVPPPPPNLRNWHKTGCRAPPSVKTAKVPRGSRNKETRHWTVQRLFSQQGLCQSLRTLCSCGDCGLLAVVWHPDQLNSDLLGDASIWIRGPNLMST